MRMKLIAICSIAVLSSAVIGVVLKKDFKIMDELGVKVTVDEPEYGKCVISNISQHSLLRVHGIVREDFSYMDKGFITHHFSIPEMAPDIKIIIPLVYVKEGVDIGGIDVLFYENSGKAHYKQKWSYAM